MKKPYIIGIMTVGFLALVFLSFHCISWFIYNNGLHEQELGAKPVKVYTEAEVVSFIETQQAQDFLLSEKYTQLQVNDLVEKYQDKLPYETEVIEYEISGNRGFQILFIDYDEFINATTGQPYLVRKTKSYGYGVEAENRTWDWR